jgi:signal transduction histidine kinase/DNA-binding response OmpR family regulator
MFPTDEPFSLALLPLIAGKEVKGFVAFDGTNLGLCAIIVWQLAAAFRSIELYREALEARRLAEEANQMKSRFLSTVSHELRTPLNLVVGLSEMLLVEQQGGELELTRAHLQDVERIHASAQHLDGLMRDVLDLAQSETGRLTLTCEPLDLASVLRPLIAAGEQMAQEKNLAWRAEIDDDLPQVWGDRTRLRQVILNLLSNAVKFTARGEVALRVEVQSPIADRGSQTANRQIANCLLPIAGRKSPIADGQLPTTDGNAMRDKRLAIGDMRVIVVSVSDTGLGIPPSEQTAIFDEFRQSERTATRGYGGMGLGLAICRRLVELHGGRIEAHSSGEEGGGSTFIVALPAMETRAPDPAEIRSEAREQTVLLLCEQGREELEQHLTGQGFVVETMEPTEAALVTLLARLRAAPPGAVVLDAGLASRQGWRVLAALKQDPATIEVPVLFYALEPRENSGALLEMDYLTKPVGTAELAQALQRQGLVTQEEAKTILVVDDEPGILEMHARIIQSQLASCRVLRAGNGRDALALLKAEQPDLVLLDLMMPELDGFGVLEKMRAQETTRDVPVIVLTGQLLTEREMDRLNQGVAAVLGKGLFTAEETLAHVESALARTRRLGSDARRMVRRAMAFIHEHHAEAISSKTIAHHLGVSKGHLSRSFRQEMDLTPTKYLNRYRVQRAKELLAAGDTSVTEVAMAVGFSDASYFSRIFRREVGIPPTDYRLAESEDR